MKKKLELSRYGVRSLDLQELKTSNGGVWGFVLGLVGSAVYDCIANHEAFVEGFNEGYKDAT